jgi:hypothetical protein
MNDPLSSSRQELARAEKHFVDLQKEILGIPSQDAGNRISDTTRSRMRLHINSVRADSGVRDLNPNLLGLAEATR